MGTRLYVGRLSYDVRERDLERFFKGFGRIREILLKNGFGFVEFDDYRDADDAVYELNGKEFFGERVVVQVARAPGSRNRQFGYRRRANWADKYGRPARTEYRLIVENLSSGVSWQWCPHVVPEIVYILNGLCGNSERDHSMRMLSAALISSMNLPYGIFRDLKDYMRQAGEVTYADAHKQVRNEGVVEFGSYADMKTALEKFDNTELNGRRIKLVEDNPHSRRSRGSPSRSRSRSYTRRRSRSRSRSYSTSKSRSKSPSRSRSQSKTPKKDDGSRSKSRSPSREQSRSKSPSRSPVHNKHLTETNEDDNKD